MAARMALNRINSMIRVFFIGASMNIALLYALKAATTAFDGIHVLAMLIRSYLRTDGTELCDGPRGTW